MKDGNLMNRKIRLGILFLTGLFVSFAISNISNAADEVAKLTTAPEVPAALSRAGGANVTVELETSEKRGHWQMVLNIHSGHLVIPFQVHSSVSRQGIMLHLI